MTSQACRQAALQPDKASMPSEILPCFQLGCHCRHQPAILADRISRPSLLTICVLGTCPRPGDNAIWDRHCVIVAGLNHSNVETGSFTVAADFMGGMKGAALNAQCDGPSFGGEDA